MTTAEPRRCTGCGAPAPRPEARFCEHCGARLAEPAPAPAPHDPLGDVRARFEALAGRPELAALLTEKPAVPELAGKLLPSLALLAGLTLLGFFAALVCFQVCPPLGFVPLALVGVGVLVIVRQLLWSSRTPLVARIALVVERRAQLQAGAERSPAHTRHFVTLELEDGSRIERECYASALPVLAPGAMGVAYLKGERLAAFAALPV